MNINTQDGRARRRMLTTRFAALSLALLGPWAWAQHAAGAAPAAPHRALPGPAWRGDISHFHEQDWQLWRRGRWVHSSHDGRYGWWWLAGGLWYSYPSPVYPVPNPFEPPLFNVQPLQQAPAARVWYYCEAAAAYYPYVAACPDGWKPVPAVPAPAPTPPVQ